MERALTREEIYRAPWGRAAEEDCREHSVCSAEDFKALLSPAAEPFLEQMAESARMETGRHQWSRPSMKCR